MQTTSVSDVVEWALPTVTDNSGETLTPVLQSGQESGSQFSIGSHDIVYNATDSSGNTGQCHFVVEIQGIPWSRA